MTILTDSSFAERFAYARWARCVEEDDKALALRSALSAGWVAKWKRRAKAPPGRREGPLLARALDVEEAWLLDGVGTPPMPEWWPVWRRLRREAQDLADINVEQDHRETAVERVRDARAAAGKKRATKRAARKGTKRKAG